MEQTYQALYMPKLVTGRGSLAFFATLGKKRIGVIRGGRSYSAQVQDTVESLAAQTGAEVRCLAQIRNEPLIEDIFRATEAVRDFQPDMILAIGGGSVLDTAKAIHLFYENPDMTFEEATRPYCLPALGKKAVHVSVPTTSGTGSETTSCAVFIDPETHVKRLLLDNGIIPHYAILDASATDSLPPSITVATGMDALTHAIESSTALNSTVLTRAIALEAAVDILESLRAAAAPEDTPARRDARERMHIAASMAGIAITNSCTGICHSYDHPGPAFGLAHGLVCGLMLPYSMEMIGPHPSYSALARRLGYTGDDTALMQALKQHILTLSTGLGLPTSFRARGIDETEYLSKTAQWAKESLPAFATAVSPAAMDEEKGILFLKNCYYGETL